MKTELRMILYVFMFGSDFGFEIDYLWGFPPDVTSARNQITCDIFVFVYCGLICQINITSGTVFFGV